MGFAILDADGIAISWSRWDNPPRPLLPGETVVSADSLEDAKPTAQTLADAKAAKVVAIDAKSKTLIEQGVAFNGETVSMSRAAQINLSMLSIAELRGPEPWPQSVSTIDGREVEITNAANFMTLVDAVQTRKLAVLNAGRSLRIEVLDATTVAEVDAVTDDRT